MTAPALPRLFKDPRTGLVVGLALWLAALACFADAYGNRGRKTPVAIRFVTPL